MFKELYNEATIQFEMHTKSPLFIDSGDKNQLNPTTADNTFFRMYKDGQLVPVVPGTSMKGVFRSSAEQLLDKSCNVTTRACRIRSRRENTAKERYQNSCPTCKLFGSTALKSRISFNDAYPIGDFRIGQRTSAAIDRITGAAKGGSLYEFEYVEDATFKCEIKLKNFFRWQIKLILEIFERIDAGYVTFGGFSSKGFGQMGIGNVVTKVRYYDKEKETEGYRDKGFYIEKEIKGREQILELLRSVSIKDKNAIERSELRDDEAI
jgi:CRISPR-associated protein Csm3